MLNKMQHIFQIDLSGQYFKSMILLFIIKLLFTIIGFVLFVTNICSRLRPRLLR